MQRVPVGGYVKTSWLRVQVSLTRRPYFPLCSRRKDFYLTKIQENDILVFKCVACDEIKLTSEQVSWRVAPLSRLIRYVKLPGYR